MSRLINYVALGLGNFFHSNYHDPLVRLFEIEYNKEYRQLKALGVEITGKLARERMKTDELENSKG